MHSFTILALGKAQESWQIDAIAQYLTRLKPYATARIIEIPDESESPTTSTAQLRHREAEKIRRQIPSGSTVIALDETGKNLSSQEWADLLKNEAERGTPLAFLLGGANGLDPELRTSAQKVVTFGKHTMPHMLARIVLLEQLYRAETILRGKTYHR